MSDATGSTHSIERLRDQAIAALVPFFLDGPTGDAKEARQIAEGLLDDYHAVTPRELQLSAQIIALGWASLACLRTAAAVKTLSLEGKLDLQDSAIALDRSSQKATKALEASRKERTKNPGAMTLEKTKWDEGAFQKAINQALEQLHDANGKLATYVATLPAAEQAFITGVPAQVTPAPVAAKPKLPFLSAEQMTPSVLARRARN